MRKLTATSSVSSSPSAAVLLRPDFFRRLLRPVWLRRLVGCVAAVCMTVILVTLGKMASAALHRPADGQDCTVVVLGCQVFPDGHPSLMLRGRINAAYDYLSAHPDAVCVASGGMDDSEPITEAQCIRDTLVSMGIDPGRIYMEDRSRSTEENLAFSAELIRANGLPADVKAEAARKAEERLKYMTFYSTTPRCLRGFLLSYFGEDAPQKCGNCSNCLLAEQAAEQVEQQAAQARERAAASARRLAGGRRRNADDAPLSEADEALLGALYALRKRLAAKQKVPAYMIFNDATLREMARKKPLSLDELLNITGVGEKKAAHYGRDFLRVIEEMVESRG